MKTVLRDGLGWCYKHGAKPLFFLQDPEQVHNSITHLGELVGQQRLLTTLVKNVLVEEKKSLQQKLHGISFASPIGLAAGFDYDAKLTQFLPALGFGFGTVGTITSYPYPGNIRPILGRLPGSQSLMVNKGFKNKGAASIAQKLAKFDFAIPLGISIGRSNTLRLKTQKESIQDILEALRTFERAQVKNSYYELNISCPNLKGNITFYPPRNLRELLSEIAKLHLKKPVFIKMPIEKSDREFLQMMDVIASFPIVGVIVGNLQKKRDDPAFVPEELKRFPRGNFSGKPTYRRSNELIALTYKQYGKNMTIIGCGGVFSAKDAYVKISLGASLVQLITGLIFQGPQLVSQINTGLDHFLKRDGYSSLSQARGQQVL